MATQPDVSQIIAGPGLIYVAPVGTAQPSLATAPIPFSGTWFQVGYTDAGIDLIYTPTIKEVYVDEEAAVVLDILEKEKFVVQAHLAEVNIENLSLGISACTIAGQAITVGSLPVTYIAVAVTGPAPNGNTRVVLLSKAITTVAVSLKITRKDKQVIPVSWDARKLSGTPLLTITDVGTGYENS